MRRVASLALFLLLILPAPLHAQFAPSIEPLTLAISPTYPRPYDSVKVTVESTQLNLIASDISFTQDGTDVGSGSRSTTITMGGAGTQTTIKATVVAAEGTYAVQMTLAPAEVSLILEPTSTHHPFYKGASLVAPEAPVRLIALPDFRTNGARIAPEKLSYTWKLGEKILQDQSGIGKNVLSATAPIPYRDATVSVLVTTVDQSMAADARRTIAAAEPVIRIYKSDPLSGTDYSHALSGTFSLPSAEETVHMVAYFFENDPSLSWTLNGQVTGSGKDLTLRSASGDRGTVSLRAKATESGLIPRTAETGLTVQFGQSSTGFFGL